MQIEEYNSNHFDYTFIYIIYNKSSKKYLRRKYIILKIK